MSLEANIETSDKLFKGEDRVLAFKVYTDDTKATCLDVSGYTLSWTMRRHHGAATALLTKTTGAGVAVTGVFNADPNISTQQVEVAIADTDTAGLKAGKYDHALKRTDAGLAGVLSFGYLVLRDVAA